VTGLQKNFPKLFDSKISILWFSPRTCNALRHANIRTFRELASKTEGELLASGCDFDDLREIRATLASMELRLGMQFQKGDDPWWSRQ
jgi:DNA-directed RNA polymerase alpha subunit